MTTLYLVRRWGQHQPGENVTVDDEAQAQWLLDHNFAQRSKNATSVTDNSVAAGEHGPDPRAGGDGTRRRPTSIRSVDTRENRAWPAAGSPVQYNAGVAPTQGSGGGDDGGSEEQPAEEAGAEGQADQPSSKVSASGRRKPKAN